MYLDIDWIYFCIVFGTMLFISFIMDLQSANLYTMHVVMKRFTIIDLEFPASARELVAVIKGIFLMEPELSKKASLALRRRLILDFTFMPALYGSIFLFCMKVSLKSTSFGRWGFAILAWLQCIAWLCNIIENIYLMNKIRPLPDVSQPTVHTSYLLLAVCKWGIALTASVCSIAAMSYFWLVGRYSGNSIPYLLTIAAELVVISIAKKMTAKSEKEMLERFQQTGQR